MQIIATGNQAIFGADEILAKDKIKNFLPSNPKPRVHSRASGPAGKSNLHYLKELCMEFCSPVGRTDVGQ